MAPQSTLGVLFSVGVSILRFFQTELGVSFRISWPCHAHIAEFVRRWPDWQFSVVVESRFAAGTFKVSWSSHFQVLFRNLESVGGAGHYLHPFAAVAAELARGDENTVRLVAPRPTARVAGATRQTKSFGTLNHHHGGVGHIHTHLYYGGCHQNLRIPAGETLHLLFPSRRRAVVRVPYSGGIRALQTLFSTPNPFSRFSKSSFSDSFMSG